MFLYQIAQVSPMPRPVKRWPNYALESLEDALMHFKTIEKLGRDLHNMGKATGQPDVANFGNDARSAALSGIHALVQARTGEYDV